MCRGHHGGEGGLSFRHLHSLLGTWCVSKVIEHYIKFRSDNVIMM